MVLRDGRAKRWKEPGLPSHHMEGCPSNAQLHCVICKKTKNLLLKSSLRFWTSSLQQPALITLINTSNITSLKTGCKSQGSYLSRFMSNSGLLSPWHTAPGDLKLVRVQALALYGTQGKSLLLSGPQFSLSAEWLELWPGWWHGALALWRQVLLLPAAQMHYSTVTPRTVTTHSSWVIKSFIAKGGSKLFFFPKDSSQLVI